MVVVYYPYPIPNVNQRFYQQGPYPPWMAQPAYSYKGISDVRQWMPQPAVSDGGLSEFGLYGLNYRQPKLIQTGPAICPTCYTGAMLYPYPPTMVQAATGYGQLSTLYPWMSPSFYPAAYPVSYGQPQWLQPARMFRYY
jgi:hypothetical protein